MNKMIQGTIFVCCLALAACGTDSDSGNNTDNNTSTNSGKSDTPNNSSGLVAGDSCIPAVVDPCGGGSYCSPFDSDPCDASCVSYWEIGDTCSGETSVIGIGRCPLGTSVCDHDNTKKCIAKPTKGEECTATIGCAGDNLMCEMEKCVERPKLDEPCERFECEFDLYCNADSVCKPKNLKVGDACSDATSTQCVLGSTCDDIDGLCVANAFGFTCD